MRDPERFEEDLFKPVPGAIGQPVTESDLERDAESFVAFAAAFGVKPPTAGADPSLLDALPSATSP